MPPSRHWLVPIAAVAVVLAPAVAGLGGSDVFVGEAVLTASDAGADDEFGFSVDVGGDTVLVGAWQADTANAAERGLAYVYARDGPGQWSQQATLTPDPGEFDDAFGVSVALDGDTALVGDTQEDNANGDEAGAVYVFRRQAPGEWVRETKLLAGKASDDGFGVVALDNGTAVIGAVSDAAYVFERNGTGAWNQQARLTSDGSLDDGFGVSVAVDGATALVGAFLRDTANASDVGAAFVFEPDAEGNWTQRAELRPAADDREAWFGWRVALDGSRALVGAPLEGTFNGPNAGSAYVFEDEPAGGWTRETRLTATDGNRRGGFSWSVDLHGDTAVVGEDNIDVTTLAKPSAAYAFTRQGTGDWLEQPLVSHTLPPGPRSVAVDGDTIVVGSPTEPGTGGFGAGSVQVFRGVPGGTGTL